jgi:hypothetical protein
MMQASGCAALHAKHTLDYNAHQQGPAAYEHADTSVMCVTVS